MSWEYILGGRFHKVKPLYNHRVQKTREFAPGYLIEFAVVHRTFSGNEYYGRRL